MWLELIEWDKTVMAIEYNGHSSVISPKGEIIFTNEGGEATRTVDLNAHSLQAFRDRFPAYMDADDFTIEFEEFEESSGLLTLINFFFR